MELELQQLKKIEDLEKNKLAPELKKQLLKWGRRQPDGKSRFRVDILITEGQISPDRYIQRYSGFIIEALTETRCLWADDTQIDELHIKRQVQANLPGSYITITIP